MKYIHAIITITFLAASYTADASLPIHLKAGYVVGNNFGIGSLSGGEIEMEVAQLAIILDAGKIWMVNGIKPGGGIRYYLNSVQRKIRPHLTITYSPAWYMSYGYSDSLSESVEKQFLNYGVSILFGFDHDFGKQNGFILTYGDGISFPQDYSKKEKMEYYNSIKDDPKKPEIRIPINIGIKYQF
jgi:hypothetical protein